MTRGPDGRMRLSYVLAEASVDPAIHKEGADADTYNNKIKTIRPESRTAETLAGSGGPGCTDGPAGEAEFREPAGLSVAAGRIYVSDTNNHAIRVVDLTTKEVTTLPLKGI